MASTNGRDLTLTTTGANTKIEVKYNAVFSPLERHLAANGLIFQERIAVIGVDPPDSTLHNFPVQNLPVTAGAVQQTIARNRSMTVTRASLQEDAGLGDADEIRCKIVIRPVGLPSEIADFSDLETILG